MDNAVRHVCGVLVIGAVAGGATAQVSGETQPVTWEEVEGLRLSSVGYRSTDDPCRRAGETALTVDFLDHTADLVACPSGDLSVPDLIERFDAMEAARTESYTLFSVPRH